MRLLIAVVTAWALFSSHALAAEWGLDPNTTRRVEALFNEYARRNSPGYVVGIVREGKIVFSRSYGMANLDHAVPLSPKTSFHLASLSKQFTAAAAAPLIQQGKLSLEDPVGRWVPQAAKYGPDLKLKHLIYMTSGLPEYFGLVREDRYGLEMWAYSGGDLDASTYMARFPSQRLTVICLSNMPTGAADEKCRAMLEVLHTSGRLKR